MAETGLGVSVKPILQQSWDAYKSKFIQGDGRVMDLSQDAITTSEGQSYALLRAVWMNDQPTFGKAWEWSQKNLGYKDTGLFAWKWGKHCDNSWAILDKASATDADQDIAFALILAGKQWSRPELIEQAKAILSHIWDKEVVQVSGHPYLAAGVWAIQADKVRLNPSYFAPYEYRVFAKIDPQHNWNGLVDTSYQVLEAAGKESRLGLPPDWCNLDAKTGAVSVADNDKQSDYSYDAMRVPWRVALDWQWNQDPRAKKYLDSLGFLQDSWKVQRTIRGAYTNTGVMRGFDEPIAGFGCVLPMFELIAPDLARQVYQEKLQSVYYDGLWKSDTDYYGQNWAWFGLAAAGNLLAKPQI